MKQNLIQKLFYHGFLLDTTMITPQIPVLFLEVDATSTNG